MQASSGNETVDATSGIFMGVQETGDLTSILASAHVNTQITRLPTSPDLPFGKRQSALEHVVN